MATAPQDISRSLQAFAAGFHEQGKQLSELQASSPSTFQHVILSLLMEARDTPRFRFLIAYLSSRGLLPQCIQGLRQVDRGLAALVVEMAERMLPEGLPPALAAVPPAPDPEAGYLLGLLEAFATGLNLLALNNGPAGSLDTRVRARLALILGKAARTHDAFLTLAADADPRVRANCIEALWGSASATARVLFEQGTRDPHHRVAANAFIGQYLQGNPASVAGLVGLIHRPDTASKAAAAWAMGRTGDSRFTPLLQAIRRLPGQDPVVVRNCLGAIRRVQQSGGAEHAQGLSLRILDARRESPGRVTLSVSARVPGELAPPKLAGTSFHLTAGEEPVWDYTCQEVDAGPALAAAFLLPVGLEGMRSKGRMYQAVLEQAFLRRREADRIALALYSETPIAAPNPLYGPGLLTSEPGQIRETLSDLPGPAHVPQGPSEPLSELVENLKRFDGESHAIWLVDGLAAGFIERFPVPDFGGVKLHAVCTPRASEAVCRFAAALARGSGGTYIHLEESDEAGTACDDLGASMYFHYRLTCPDPREAVRWSLVAGGGRYTGKTAR